MALQWADHDKHESLRVASQGELQEVRELFTMLAVVPPCIWGWKNKYLAVPVRDMASVFTLT